MPKHSILDSTVPVLPPLLFVPPCQWLRSQKLFDTYLKHEALKAPLLAAPLSFEAHRETGLVQALVLRFWKGRRTAQIEGQTLAAQFSNVTIHRVRS